MGYQQVKRIASVALLAPMLLGCGKAPSLAAVPHKARPIVRALQVVSQPVAYNAGQAVPSAIAPSVTQVAWPKIATTKAGVPSDPVNLVVTGDERHVRHVFRQAGWVEAENVNVGTALRTITTTIFGGKYANSPMSDLFLFDRKQDMALQKNAIGTRARDHLRVWRTPGYDRLGRPVWAIAATEDVAIKLAPGEKLPTHQISPFIDDERQLVVDDFVKSGHVALRYQLQSLPENFRSFNGGGDGYITDGKAEVLELVPMKFSK